MKHDHERAKDLQLKLLPLNDVLTKKYGVVAYKEALSIMGKPAGFPKSPLLALKEEARTEIGKVLTDLGLV